MLRRPHAPPRPLQKQQSWSPDMVRDEAWQRRRRENNSNDVRGGCGGGGHRRLSKSLSEDDLEELKACMELGFGFDSPEINPKLQNTIPALELYHAVNRQYHQNRDFGLSRSSSFSSIVSDCDTSSSSSPNTTLFLPGDDLAAKKTRLKQWAKVVACAVRHSSPPSSTSPSQPHQSNQQIIN